MPTPVTDVIDAILNLCTTSEIAQLRQFRAAATESIQQSYQHIFTAQAKRQFNNSTLYELARHAASIDGNQLLADYYQTQLTTAGEKITISTSQLKAGYKFATSLIKQPNQATQHQLTSLQEHGYSEDSIILLAQLIAYVSFQGRLITGLQWLQGLAAPTNPSPTVAAQWHKYPTAANGWPAPTKFTLANLEWLPWLAPLTAEALNHQQRQQLQQFNQLNHPYFLLLARHADILLARTLADRAIFYTSGGLPKAERELAAAVASKVNGCIYCASVHARKAAQLAKRQTEITQLLAIAPNAALINATTEPRWQAIIDVAASLSASPAILTQQQLTRLQHLDFSLEQLLDLVQATAFFAWANRLMLTLGEPYLTSTEEKLA